MIVPMKKISLVVMGDKKREALKKLRQAGIIHIEITEGSGKRIDELKEQVALLESAVFLLSEKKNKKVEQKDITASEAVSAAKEITSLAETKKAYLNEQHALTSELERLKSWGDVNPDEINDLLKKGVNISFYEMPKAEYDSIPEAVKTISLEKTKNSVKLALIISGVEDEETAEKLKSYRFELPQISTADIKQKLEEISKATESIDKKISGYAGYNYGMKKTVKSCEKEIEFEVYATGMANESLSENDKKDVSVAYFTGYVEEENLSRLKEIAGENAWGLLIEEPTEEDNVPTKLKNNKFVSLIYPLTDFLGTVPGYFEYDISGWFLGFILIFFGIIFGDGVYGLLISAVAALLIIKSANSVRL